MTAPAWPPAAGCAAPGGPAGSAACPHGGLAGERVAGRSPRWPPAGRSAGSWPARRPGTAARCSAPRTAAPGPARAGADAAWLQRRSPTTTGRPASRAMVSQVRGAVAASSTAQRTQHRRSLSGQVQEDVFQGAPLATSSRTRTPAPTSSWLSCSGGIAVRRARQLVAVRVDAAVPGDAASTRLRAVGVGRVDSDPPGRGQQVGRRGPGRPAGRWPSWRPGCRSARPRRAGGWTGTPWCPARTSSTNSERISWMPWGSRPLVGSSSTRRRGVRSNAAASPRRWRMPSE